MVVVVFVSLKHMVVVVLLYSFMHLRTQRQHRQLSTRGTHGHMKFNS